MAWKKVSETRWERPMNGYEGYFAAIAKLAASVAEGREHYTLSSILKLELASPDPTSALQHAWKQVRYEQPQIAAVTEGMTKSYEVPDAKTLEAWLAETFTVSDANSAGELYQTVATGGMPHAAMLYYVPNSSELLFRGQHHNIDGIGVFMFWDAYLKALASPVKDFQWGNEMSRLAPSLEEALGYPEPPTPEQAEKAKAQFMDWASVIPGVGPVSKVGTVPSGNCRHTELRVPAETTEAIVKACKEKNTTVTAALHAAYVSTIIKYAAPNSKSEYVTAISFDLRTYLPEPYDSSDYAVSFYFSPRFFRHPLPSSFWDIEKALKNAYHTTFKGNQEALATNAYFGQAILEGAQTPEFLTTPIPSDALVSSLGVSERYMKREYAEGIKVVDVQFYNDVVMGMSGLHFYTFRDQLRMIFNYNDGFEESEDIQKYLDEVMSTLKRELLS
jgi:hypothetical protein